ncbi:MAG: phage tail protein [Comamonadaceae bacterium]|nr:MAG: phage tail protein [Comamonadaceae bacterium]
MARTPSGTRTSVAKKLGAPVAFTAITNAAEAVCTAANHTLQNGNIILVESGWGRLNMRAARVKAVAGNNFTLEKIDTSNLELFSAGAGAGTFRVVDPQDWVELDRTKNHTTSGGDAKTIMVKWTESDNEIPLGDGFSAVQRSFEMDADMLGSVPYNTLVTLSETQALTIARRRPKNGSFTLIPCTISFNEEEVESEGQPVINKATVNAQNRSTRYGPAA